jgi:hypothetical protein
MNNDLKLRLTPFKELDPACKQFWYWVVHGLMKTVDSPFKTTIHMVKIDPPAHPDDDTGFVEFVKPEFHVYLDNRMPFGMVVDYLIHELAHVGTWWVNEPEDHGPMFGVEYARLYREYLNLYDTFWSPI